MEQATDLLEIIHTDVCGPMSVEAHGGYRYFLTFTCDLSRSMSGEIDTYGITGIPSTVGGREVVQRAGLTGSTQIVYPGSGRGDV